jgi:hypothetical protein
MSKRGLAYKLSEKWNVKLVKTAFGQEISIMKTLFKKSSAGMLQSSPSIMIKGEQLLVVQEFRYLGSIDSADENSEEETEYVRTIV